MTRDNIFTVLQTLKIPAAYSHFRRERSDPVEPPYIVYIGAGQTVDRADNTHVWSLNRYQVEYYFKEKDETQEAAIESALLSGGYQFVKSEDLYLEDEDLFVIYYETN